MQYTLHLHPEPYERIVSGSKTVESRLYDEKRKRMQAGDTVIFINRADNSSIQKTIVGLETFPSFSLLLMSIPIEKFGGTTMEEELDGLQLYYSKEEQNQYGVVAIYLQ